MSLPEGYKPYCPGNDNISYIFISPTAKRVTNESGHFVWKGCVQLKKPTKIKKLKFFFARRGYINLPGIKAISKPKKKKRMKDLLTM